MNTLYFYYHLVTTKPNVYIPVPCQSEWTTMKCTGRFNELTAKVAEALSFIREKTPINESNPVDEVTLRQVYELLKDELSTTDPLDPYAHSSVDILRSSYTC